MDKVLKRLSPKGDKIIWLTYLFFALMSVVAVFSSSTYISNKSGGDKMMILYRQLAFVAAGFIIVYVGSILPIKVYRSLAFLIAAISAILLMLSLIPGMGGVSKNEAVRGLKIGDTEIQVFEIVKVGVILYLAKALELWGDSIASFKDYALRYILPVAAICCMVIPNGFSSTVLIAVSSLMLLFFMGIDWKYLLLTVAGAAALLLLMIGIYDTFYADRVYENDADKTWDYKFFNRVGTIESRVASFKAELFGNDEEMTAEKQTSDEKKDHFQSEQSKIAIYQGGIGGKGPGKSTMRFSLPEAYSDFIFAFIIEEYGLFFGLGIIFLYAVLLFRCVRLANECTLTFTSALVLGLGFLISIQALIHIMVNVRLMPITGQTLPIISKGGWASLSMSAAFGMILSVSRQIDRQKRDREAAAEGNRRRNAGEIAVREEDDFEQIEEIDI